MDLLLIRHGESFANTGKIFSNSVTMHGLTEKGVNQATAAAKALVPFFGIPERIYSSPIRRAFETAAIFSAENSVEHRVLPELAEISVGELEGKSDAASWRLNNIVWDKWFRMGDMGARLPGGESLKDASDRFLSLLSRLKEEEGESSKLVLISHGGFILSALSNIVYDVPDFIPRRAYIDNCDMIRISADASIIKYTGFKAAPKRQ